MWWMPLIALGMNKMKEKEAKEEAERQQLHSIRSNTASMFGSPGIGEQAARQRYDTERRIEEERKRRNQQMMQSVFSGLSDNGSEE